MSGHVIVQEVVATNLPQAVTGVAALGTVAMHVQSPAGAPIIVMPADGTRYNVGPAISGLISAAPTRPLEFRGRNVAAALRYLMLFDVAALPVADGTPPDYYPIVPVPAGALFALSFYPALSAAGFAWYCSSTDVTLTAAVGNDMEVGAEHRP